MFIVFLCKDATLTLSLKWLQMKMAFWLTILPKTLKFCMVYFLLCQSFRIDLVGDTGMLLGTVIAGKVTLNEFCAITSSNHTLYIAKIMQAASYTLGSPKGSSFLAKKFLHIAANTVSCCIL